MKEKNKNLIPVFSGIIIFIAALVVTILGYSSKAEGAVTKEHTLIIAGLIFIIVGLTVSLSSISGYFSHNSVISDRKSKDKVLFLSQAALFAALSYIGFQFFRFDIPVAGDKTAFHFGNTFCVLAALLLGGSWGGAAGAVGLTIADLTSGYVTSAPKTFLLKLCIGLITGFVAHKLFHLSKPSSEKKVVTGVIVSAVCGMAFNIIADPVVGYFYKTYLMGVPQDAAVLLTKMASVTTAVNALTSVVLASVIYIALRPVLIKSGLFIRLEKDEK